MHQMRTRVLIAIHWKNHSMKRRASKIISILLTLLSSTTQTKTNSVPGEFTSTCWKPQDVEVNHSTEYLINRHSTLFLSTNVTARAYPISNADELKNNEKSFAYVSALPLCHHQFADWPLFLSCHTNVVREFNWLHIINQIITIDESNR